MRSSAFVGRASEDAWYISPPLAAKPPVFPPPPGSPVTSVPAAPMPSEAAPDIVQGHSPHRAGQRCHHWTVSP